MIKKLFIERAIGTYLTTDVIAGVVFTTTWDLLSSTKNHDVLHASITVGRLVGILHQSALLYKFPVLVAIFCPSIAKSLKLMIGYVRDMINRSTRAREDDPELKDNFGQYRLAKDPETGQTLTEREISTNSVLFIGAGKYIIALCTFSLRY